MFNLTKGKSTKKLIVELLGSEWPLSSMKIYNRLKNNYSFSITYQAVYKAICELVEENVLQKEGKEYKINIEWINSIEALGRKLREHYTTKEHMPYLEVGCGSSIEKDGFEAGREAAQKALNEFKFYKKPCFALAFICLEYEGKFEEVLSGISSVIGNTQLIGCTGVGAFKDKKLQEGVVLTLIASKNFEASATIIEDIKIYSDNYKSAAEYLIQKNSIKDPSFGILLIPGLCESNDMSSPEYPIVRAFKKIIDGRFPIIGAQSSDNWRFKKTYQFYNGKAYSNAAILSLIKTKLKFGINGRSAYKSLNGKTYKIKVRNNSIVRMSDSNEASYESAIKTYENDTRIRHEELKQSLPLFIKEKISQNVLMPIGAVSEPVITCYPMQIVGEGIRFEYNFDNDTLIQIKKTTKELLVQNIHAAVKEAIEENGIKKPKLTIIFPCCIFDAILSKVGINEIESLNGQSFLGGSRVVGTYTYGEIGMFDGQIKSASGTVVCLVLGDEIEDRGIE